MYYERYYSIHSKEIKDLDTILQSYGIKVDVEITYRGTYWMVFEVSENHPKFEELSLLLPPSTDFDLPISDDDDFVNITYSPKYSKEEFMEADWLSIESTFLKISPENRWDIHDDKCFNRIAKRVIRFPMKSKQDIDRNNCSKESDENVEKISLWHHMIPSHKNQVVVRSPIKWRQKYFATLDTGGGPLFCSEEARRILTKEKVRGIKFDPVLRYSTFEPIGDFYRIEAEDVIPDTAFVPVKNMELINCPICGSRMLVTLHPCKQYGIYDNILDKNVDFYVSSSIFCGNNPQHKDINGFYEYVISNRLYRILKENKMDRALRITPLPTIKSNSDES